MVERVEVLKGVEACCMFVPLGWPLLLRVSFVVSFVVVLSLQSRIPKVSCLPLLLLLLLLLRLLLLFLLLLPLLLPLYTIVHTSHLFLNSSPC